MEEIEYSAGTEVLKQGSGGSSSGFFVVQAGRAKVCKRDEKSRIMTVVEILSPGGFPPPIISP